MDSARSSLEVLLIEDNLGDAKLIEHHLRAPGVDHFTGAVGLTHRKSLAEGLSELEDTDYDLLFLDLNLPDSSGLDTLDHVADEGPEIPIVVLTGVQEQGAAVEAIQHGAQDYLPKPHLDADRLARSLRYAVERHRQEQELRRQNRRLERFASMVSHDLRSPLNVAKNRVLLAREEADSDHLRHASTALGRMETIVKDLLALAVQGQRVEETEPVALSEMADRTWQLMDTEAATITIASDVTFRASPDRLQELLENLFRNAVDHGPEGIAIRVGAVNGDAGFFVADDGSGITEEMQEVVFEFGYTTDDGGTGIGLAIVQEIATAHGWTCRVTESEAGGARFEITGVDPSRAEAS